MNGTNDESGEGIEVTPRVFGSDFISPAAYDPELHREEVRSICSPYLGEMSDLDFDVLTTRMLIATFQRARRSYSRDVGLAAFFAPEERIPIKKDVRERIEQILLMFSDALAFINNGDLSWLEAGQPKKLGVTRVRLVAERFAEGGDFDRCMSDLAHCFEWRSMVGTGLDPWDPERVWAWAQSDATTSEYHLALFLLNVWNSGGRTPWPGWNFFESMRRLDDDSVSVIRAWMTCPWFP